MDKIFILSFWVSLLSIVSCRDEALDVDRVNNVPSDSTVMVGKAPSDSLQIKHTMQSNPELILADRIIYKDSMFVLDLSQKEAAELHISNETYQKYVELAEMMNKDVEN